MSSRDDIEKFFGLPNETGKHVCKKLSEPAYWISILKPSLISYLNYLAQTKYSLQKDKIQSQYISELTIIKRCHKEMDGQYDTVVEALESFAVSWPFIMDNGVDIRLCCLRATAKYMKGYGSVENAMLLY
ncbi:15978_t:CDS:2 [Acaulospora colombiana]|uniref:15978_t:CDS:1 n=1 Tax=Acaulospora colombiana TaxID=27376 RepID=A0ACA9K677_9GLOM|nr:15978_t:CDS:2 [Acaulospora colombiana]